MDDRTEGMRNIFAALASKKMSRNKFPGTFSQGWAKQIHRRFKIVESIVTEAKRLAVIPGTACSVLPHEDRFRFFLQNDRMQYKRESILYDFEWHWLSRQETIQQLISAGSVPVLH